MKQREQQISDLNAKLSEACEAAAKASRAVYASLDTVQTDLPWHSLDVCAAAQAFNLSFAPTASLMHEHVCVCLGGDTN